MWRGFRWIAGGLLMAMAAAGGAVAQASASAPSLPDGRAYELVSPPGKYWGVGGSNENIAPYAFADGDHVMFQALMPLPGSQNGSRNDYLASRTADGWSTSPLLPALSSDWGFGMATQQWTSASADGRYVLYATRQNFDAADQDYQQGCLCNGEDLYLRQPDGTMTWVSRGTINNDVMDFIQDGVVSPDGSHVAFQSVDPLLAEDQVRGSGTGLYLWHDGVLQLISVGPDGQPLPNGAVLGYSGSAGSGLISKGVNAISTDGSRVFFTADGHAYVYEEGTGTRALGTPANASGFEDFFGAAADGSKAWILSDEALTADDQDTTVDLYEWRASDASLTRVSGGDSSIIQDARVSNTGGRVSDDGSRVYFFAQGTSLAAGAPTLPAFGPTQNMYLRDGSATKFIATLPAFELPTPPDCMAPANWRVSPDGRKLLFQTTGALTADDQDTSVDLYEYSEDAGALTLVSTGSSGGNGAFDADLGLRLDDCGTPPYNEERSMSDDGRYVFFTTQESLVPEDVNGMLDVYRHDMTIGTTALISSGTSTSVSALIGVGSTGRDVVFSTRDQLVPEDQDTSMDLYDARIGGGFHRVAAPQCQGEECQGQAHGPGSSVGAPGSATYQGRDATPAATAEKQALTVAGLSPAQLRQLARTGSVKLRIKVARAGTITVVGKATVRGRRLTVVRRVAKLAAGKTTSVTVRLNAVGRRELRRKHALRVSIRVSVSPGGIAKSLGAPLRLPRAAAASVSTSSTVQR